MSEIKNKFNNSENEEPFGLGSALELFSEVTEITKMINNLINIYSDFSKCERDYERFNTIISQYNEQPHLLDKHLESILEQFILIIRSPNYSCELKHATFRYMSIFINVRGYKTIVRLLPHEVGDFEAVLKMLEAQDPNDSNTWTTRYVLLLWMSIIIMIPFHLARFDGYVSEINTDDTKNVMERVLGIIKIYTVVPDKCMDAAAYLSARFISRNDVKETHLSSYLDWAMDSSLKAENNIFLKQGTLSSVAMILKHTKREDLLPYSQKLLQWIVNDDIKKNSGTIVQKLVYKIIQRIGLVLLPPRIASWRYKRGNRSLTANLCGGDGITSSSQPLPEPLEENIEIPDEIEEVIDQLIQGLRSTDGIVRWSSAKGVGRVTDRLPRFLADEVVGSILELFSQREGDGAWHGSCLALAELGRRGLLLPNRLPEVVAVVVKALIYDEPRGYSSVGSHIRDAACYVCWAFARAYETEVLKPFVKEIAAKLLIVACFDREINCRRAASAAFQENVGRQGTFPHGIDILTVADFYAVSVRNNSYLTISAYIAQFEEYTVPLITHLLDKKVDHWDSVIRDLSAKSLCNLTPKAPEFMVESVLPVLFEKTQNIDLNCRHGAVLAIGAIIFSLYQNSQERIDNIIGNTLHQQLQNLISNFRLKFYFRGIGGELMRQACCNFIENCSHANLDVNIDVSVDWLNLIHDCISYNVLHVQLAAIKALPVVLDTYFASPNQFDKQHELVKRYVSELQSTNQQESRMGHALAIGVLPIFILRLHFKIIFSALIEATKITTATEKWAESRRNAIKSLTAVTISMSDEIICGQFGEEVLLYTYDILFESLCDYTQDKRGDVGAWVREAAITSLQDLTFEIAQKKPEYLTEALMTKIITGIAQQAVEKIDRTRAVAARVFYRFLNNVPKVPNIPQYEDLCEFFSEVNCKNLNWNSACDTFPLFAQLLQFQPYTYKIMLGFVCSVGGLTETLVKNSSAALFAYFISVQDIIEINRLCNVIYQIFINNLKSDRITTAMFRFLDKLFSSGAIQVVLDDTESKFARSILKLVLSKMSECKDTYKLIDGINLLSQFIQIKNETCRSALTHLCIYLCHRQIYIRKSTSSVLYEALLVYGENAYCTSKNLDEIMEILSSTNWEQSIEIIKPIRNKLCCLFEIKVPTTIKKKTIVDL